MLLNSRRREELELLSTAGFPESTCITAWLRGGVRAVRRHVLLVRHKRGLDGAPIKRAPVQRLERLCMQELRVSTTLEKLLK